MSSPHPQNSDKQQLIAAVLQGFSILQADGDKAGAVSKGFSILLSAKSKTKPRGKCSKCKKRGHLVKDCWFARKSEGNEGAPPAKKQAAEKQADVEVVENPSSAEIATADSEAAESGATKASAPETR